jgi:hypothetical protein
MEGGEESDSQVGPREMRFVDMVWSGLVLRRARMLGQDEVGPMDVSPGVLGGEVGKGEKVFGLGADHLGGDARAKLNHLESDIPEESVGRPTFNEHDSKNRNPSKVHDMAITAPERMEWVPMSSGEKPSRCVRRRRRRIAE